MSPLLIEVSEVVRGVPKRRVFEWLTDYQSFDPQVSRARLRERRVIERPSHGKEPSLRPTYPATLQI